MTKIRLSHIHEFRDRLGKVRRYVRLSGGKRIPLKGAPGSDEFMEIYRAALAEVRRPEIGALRTVPGTVNAAVVSYFNSAAFQAGAPDTRRTRRNILERFRAEHGDKRIALLQRTHIERMVAAKAATPSAARNFLNTIRALMGHCIIEGMRTDDPTQGVKRVPIKTTGYRTWTEADIAQFEAAHPVGSRARLALALLLYTGQRRSDVVLLGRQYLHAGRLHLRQQKTRAELVIPVHPDLAVVLDATPSSHLTFLTTATGKPFSAAGFTNWFRDMCNEAGLPKGTSAHGLRKAACRRLAEAGASANVIAAISGHATLAEVARYTRAADQLKMAEQAIDMVVAAFPSTRT
ncbi:MAG TPA: tyrosine-type recombinase/integrase [Stellaceae bacterium]|nr:tyrosine-type recombinase/integrase [Stellaceae bacterium]